MHIQGSMGDRSWELIQIYQCCRCLAIRQKVCERFYLLYQVRVLKGNPQSSHDTLVDGLFGLSLG
jgi:hypothetical protein